MRPLNTLIKFIPLTFRTDSNLPTLGSYDLQDTSILSGYILLNKVFDILKVYKRSVSTPTF